MLTAARWLIRFGLAFVSGPVGVGGGVCEPRGGVGKSGGWEVICAMAVWRGVGGWTVGTGLNQEDPFSFLQPQDQLSESHGLSHSRL